jgi:hypothetical protein
MIRTEGSPGHRCARERHPRPLVRGAAANSVRHAGACRECTRGPPSEETGSSQRGSGPTADLARLSRHATPVFCAVHSSSTPTASAVIFCSDRIRRRSTGDPRLVAHRPWIDDRIARPRLHPGLDANRLVERGGVAQPWEAGQHHGRDAERARLGRRVHVRAAQIQRSEPQPRPTRSETTKAARAVALPEAERTRASST